MNNNSPAMPLGAGERYPGIYTLIETIAAVLNDLVTFGQNKPLVLTQQTGKFHSKLECPYPINAYLRRICQYAGCSNEVFVFVMIYIDRLVCKGLMNLTKTNVHRLIITTTMVAAKFYDDFFYYNPFFATVGGIKPLEINALEIELLFLLEFNLFVSREEYGRYYATLTSLAIKRGITNDPNLLPRPLPPPEEIRDVEEEIKLDFNDFFKAREEGFKEDGLLY